MKRLLFNLLAGISLLLCVATAVLWVRSYYIQDYVRMVKTGYDFPHLIETDCGLSLVSGQIVLQVQRNHMGIFSPQEATNRTNQTFSLAHPPLDSSYFNPAFGRGPLLHRWGFRYSYTSSPSNPGMDNSGTFTEIGTPHWALIVLEALLPVFWVVRRLLRRYSPRAGSCPICGYDLRATPDRCPECGTVPENLVCK